jgi:O-antigen/teichoic acid export membrane protein
MTDLQKRTVRGMAIMGLSFTVQTVLQIGFIAVLMRLVTPAQYGLVTGSLVAVFFTTLLAESGIGAAIVQRRELTRDHVRVGYTLSVALGLICWGLLAALAPWVAAALNLPQLTPYVRVVALIFVLNNLTLSDYILARRLQFGRLAIAESVAYGVGYGAVAIWLAVDGYGAWAIVWGQVAQSGLRTLLVWCFAPHPVRPLFRRREARELLGYGSGHTLGRVAFYVASQGDNFVVARTLGAAALGLYGRAYQMVDLAATLFGQVTNEVLFPAMATVQDNIATLRRVFRTGVASLALIALPVSIVAAVTSRQLVLLLLGPHWLPLRDAFDVIVFGMLFRTSTKLSDSLARATGAVYRRAWRTIVFAAAVVSGSLIGQFWGIRGVSYGVLAALFANYLLMSQLSMRLTETTWRQFAADHLPALIVTVVAGADALVVEHLLTAARLPGALVFFAVWLSAIAAALLIVRVAPQRAQSLARLISSLAALAHGRPSAVVARLIGPGYSLAAGTSP